MSDDFLDFEDEYGAVEDYFFEDTSLEKGSERPQGFPSEKLTADRFAISGDNVWSDGVGTFDEPDPESFVIPPVIGNVQRYLPHVAPNAFPVVVSALAQANIDVGVDLCMLSCATRNVEFMPKNRNACATMRLHEPSAVVLVRNSGALTVVGAAGVSEARQAAELAVRIIRKALNLQINTFRFRIRSIMGRFNACSPVRLDDLAHHSLKKAESPGVGLISCVYEPERFNGCVVRLEGTSKQNKWVVTAVVFVTGKMSMLGARSMDELRFAFDAFIPILSQYIGGTAPDDSQIGCIKRARVEGG